MITVACLLLSGGIYTPEWVARLHKQVKRHLTVPHRFVCLSDIEVPCERILIDKYKSPPWAKIELFKPGRFSGSVLYIDLDSEVRWSIDNVISLSGFNVACTGEPGYRPNVSVMYWNRPMPKIYYGYHQSLQNKYATKGEEYIVESGKPDFLPLDFVSLVPAKGEIPSAAILSYPGRAKCRMAAH